MLAHFASPMSAGVIAIGLLFFTGLPGFADVAHTKNAKGQTKLTYAKGKGPPARAKVKIGGARVKAKKTQVTFHPDWAKHPSARYGALEAAPCKAELTHRGIEFTDVQRAPGVLAPVRLPKDVGGVVYRTEIAARLRGQNPFDVFDCRLVLALSDFSKILRAREIDEVLIFSAWRPPPAKWPEGKLGTRHPGALAIDVYRLGKKLLPEQKERTWLDVQSDWSGSIGATTCGPDATSPPASAAGATTPESSARELWSLVCEAADQHLFTTILTPNYNREHHNHFHLEVTPAVTWHLVH